MVTRPELARVLGRSVRSVDRLEAAGTIKPVAPPRRGRPSRYDLTRAVPAVLAHEARPPAAGESPRDSYYRVQAAIGETKLARDRRELLPRAQVVLEGQAYIRATMAQLRAIPSRLIRAGVIPRASEPTVADLIREAQEEMARWQSVLDLERAAAEAPPERAA